MTTIQNIERIIIRQLVTDAIAAGYTVSLNDGEGWAIKSSINVDEVMGAIMDTDEETLRFRAAANMGNLNKGDYIGDVLLVYGNDGHDVIADADSNRYMDALLAPAMALAEKYAA